MLLPIVVIVAVFSRIEIAVATNYCEPPTAPEHGEVSYVSLIAGSVLSFMCDNGYHLQDKRPVRCKSDGKWSKTDVKCVAKTCDQPENPENGKVSFTSLTFRSQLKFECDDGYLLKPDGPVFCTSEGTWTTTDVQCVAKTCDLPEHPENGQVIFTSLNFGSQLNFKCNEGYRLQAKGPVYCTSDRSWNSTDVRCVAEKVLTCDSPEHPENGQVVFNSLNFGSQLKFRCDDGYRLEPSEPVFCTSDGTWNSTDVRCVEINCFPPANPKNGQVRYSSLRYGSQLRYECDMGFVLSQNTRRMCTQDGTWSNSAPACNGISKIERKQSDNVYSEGRESRATTEQSIAEGLEELSDTDDITEDDILKHSDNNDEAHKPTKTFLNDSEQVQDKNVCGPPPKVEGTLEPHLDNPEASSIGTSIAYRCEFGYVNQDSKSFRSICEWDAVSHSANWTKPDVVCIPRSCGEPGFVPNAHRIGNLFTFPNKVEFQCQEGYKLKGPAIRYCQASGAWSGRLPKCDQISCAPPANPENGRVRYSSLEYGTELRYECDKRFVLSKHEVRTCTADGTWSNIEPVCIEGSCEMPLAPKNGNVQLAGSLKVGAVALYSCTEGRTMVGPSASKCLITGEWTFPPPKCVSPCVLSAISNGSVGNMEERRISRYKSEERFIEYQVGKIFQDGETAIFRCRGGFEPIGSSHLSEDWRRSGEVVTCKDGQWSKSLECKPESCYGEPPPVNNGYPLVNNRSHGIGINYDCNIYYVKVARGDVKCSYGQWTGETPRCIDGRCYVSQLNHPELEKPPVDFIEHGKNYPAQCKEGFKASTTSIKISCNTGKWNIIEGNCVPESCYGEPPPVDHGQPVVNNNSHGFGIYYLCDNYYVKAGRDNVKCSYGKWTGETPRCIDGRCYVSQLNHLGLEKPPVDFIEHGKDYPAKCKEGLRASRMKISCNAGNWNGIEDICVSDTCDGDPPLMDNGYPVVVNRSHGYGIYYRCNKYYVKSGEKGNVKCSYGQWIGNTPTCIDGRCYVSQLNHPRLEKPPVEFIEDEKDYPATCIKGFKASNQWIKVSCNAGKWNVTAANCVRVNEVTTLESSNSQDGIPKQPETCFCTFKPRSQYLEAVVNGRQLKYGDSVKKGDAALLSCRNLAMHLFWPNRMRTLDVNMTCEVCEAWGSNELPSCEQTDSAHSIIVLNKNVEVQPGGAVESRLGKNLRIECINWNTNFPDWAAPLHLPLSYDHTIVNRQLTVFRSFVHIHNFGHQHIGNYECSTRSRRDPRYSFQSAILNLITKCRGEPYGIPYGRYSIQSRSHNSRVEYECDDSYEMTRPSTVQCLHGEWTGQPAQCIKAIPAASVSVGQGVTSTVTSNNSTPKPIASKEISLGEEDDCFCTYNNPDRNIVAKYFNERLSYGDKVKKGTWTRLTCVDQTMHLVLPNGTESTTGVVKLTCSVCETWEVDQMPTCEATYLPGLTCPQIVINGIEVKYSNGRKVGSTATFSCIDSSLELVGRNFTCLENGTWDNNQKPCCQRISVPDKVTPNPPASTESTSEEDCVCTYRYYWRRTALLNGKQIWRDADIRKGESIQLGCFENSRRLVLPNGTMIMSKSITWTCYCDVDGASEIPTCEEVAAVTCPQHEETEGITVRYSNGRRVYSTATFSCTAPLALNGPSSLQCQQTGVWNSIQPTCRTVTCPQLEITEGITVKYTNERRVGSTATFNCIDPLVLHGQSTLRCLQAGEWNNSQPICLKPVVLCPPIPETDVFSVQFPNGRIINSTAYFHCKDANLIIAGGLDTRTCQQSGEWSGANPDCEAPGCLIGDFTESAPKNLLPNMDGVTGELQPVGSQLSMHCDEDWILTENKKATCGRLGKWNFGKAQCVNGCQLNIEDKSSALIIKPDNNYYRVGESVTMSCLEGFKLTSDVERVMCMADGWSNPIPNCKNETMK